MQVTCKNKQMNASNILQNLDIPKTKARLDILDFLINLKAPTSIMELKVGLPTYNESTLYRNLDKFINLGIVKKLNLNSDYCHFEFQELSLKKTAKHSHHHHHIVCTECKTIQCLDICGLESLFFQKIQKLGFTNINHTLEFSGLCKNCS